MSSTSSYTYSMILPGLYLGGDGFLLDPNLIQEANISHVVSIGYEYGSVGSMSFVREHLHIPIEDLSSAPLDTYFCEVIEFIHGARVTGNNVLVHCGAGKSRSAATTIAYVMAAADIPLPGAHAHVANMHKPAAPNDGFRIQLLEFEKSPDIAELKGRLRELSDNQEELQKSDTCFISEKSKITISFSSRMHEAAASQHNIHGAASATPY